MAKSIRSKSKRKMRAIKREKNSIRELVKLVKLAALDKKLLNMEKTGLYAFNLLVILVCRFCLVSEFIVCMIH